MKLRRWIAATAGVVLVGAAAAASAQHGPGAGASQPPKRPQMEQPGAVQDRDQLKQQDMDQLRDRDKDMDRLLDRDRDRLQDKDIYGSAFMTQDERDQYRKKIGAAKSDQQWAQIQAEHQFEMQARAKTQGKDLDPPIYGQHMMTVEERARFAEKMQAASTDAEREQVRSAHREFIRNRARELGVDEVPVRR